MILVMQSQNWIFLSVLAESILLLQKELLFYFYFPQKVYAAEIVQLSSGFTVLSILHLF